ncbi:sodium:solute symporter family transporter, partial [Staphylococcus hominis]|uniref:sodium:solute symporter family transporter n=1 Tax=Staphylococcus hominis TaxID=1290 RepID=UPI0039BFB93A
GVKLNDPETLFILMGQILFHPLVGGFLLAAILAAIMSTISSQLLVTFFIMSRKNIKNQASQNFYMLHKALFVNEKYKKLSDSAKVTYAILNDR